MSRRHPPEDGQDILKMVRRIGKDIDKMLKSLPGVTLSNEQRQEVEQEIRSWLAKLDLLRVQLNSTDLDEELRNLAL